MNDADLKTMLRVWESIRVNPDTSCWEWRGSFRNSYPSFSFLPEELPGGFPGMRLVRPWLFTFWMGYAPRRHLAGLPACNNPKCVLPEHQQYKSRFRSHVGTGV